MSLLLAAAFIGGGAAQADTIDAPFLPPFPEVTAQGGSFTANASGFNSLFYNPAAFSTGAGSFTLYSTSSWLYADPIRLLGNLGTSAAADWLAWMDEQLAAGGLGFGFFDGIGYVANGLGFGLAVNVDLYLYGDPAPTAAGDLVITAAYVSGVAVPVDLGPLKLKLGADIRPLIRIQAPADYAVMTDLVNAQFAGGNPLATLNTTNALYGWAVALDLGAILEWGPLKLGVVVRDFPRTRFHYTDGLFGDIIAALRDTGDLPAGGAAVGGYYLPMDLSVGLAFAPVIPSLRGKFEPVVHAALSDLVAVARDGRSFLMTLHAGAEVRMFRILLLRAGLNQGHFTFGAGLQFWWIDLQAAVFTRELGQRYGDQSSSGLSVEAAVRIPTARKGRP